MKNAFVERLTANVDQRVYDSLHAQSATLPAEEHQRLVEFELRQVADKLCRLLYGDDK